jgi:tRNA A-37 threonylcarbamoyl transferase component Bud32
MHDRAVSHRDLKASNLLLEMGYSPMLIDLVGVRAGESVSFARRARELARLNASFLTCHAVTSTVRLRFLSAYLSAGERPSRDWKEWWSAISGATQAKIAKNQRSGRPLG